VLLLVVVLVLVVDTKDLLVWTETEFVLGLLCSVVENNIVFSLGFDSLVVAGVVRENA